MDRSERRRSVRMKPIGELPAAAERVGGGLQPVPLRVVDVSVGGIALARDAVGLDLAPGSKHVLKLSLANYGEHEVNVVVMWRGEALVGARYVDLERPATTAVRAYVAELLERGAPS